jgi:hypothetical protein
MAPASPLDCHAECKGYQGVMLLNGNHKSNFGRTLKCTGLIHYTLHTTPTIPPYKPMQNFSPLSILKERDVPRTHHCSIALLPTIYPLRSYT